MVGSIYIPRTGSVSDIIDTDDVVITGEDADTKQFIIDLLTLFILKSKMSEKEVFFKKLLVWTNHFFRINNSMVFFFIY